MSTVTRRNKEAAARKSQRALFGDLIEQKPKAKAPAKNGAKPKEEAQKALRDAKPIYADLSHVRDYTFTDHAMEQMNARNISPAEALSAIANPDSTRGPDKTKGHTPDTKTLIRGDIQVIVGTAQRSVVTVVDLDADIRTEPRKPQVANLILGADMPAVLPDLDATVGRGVPKGVPDNDDTRWVFGRHLRKDVRFMDISPVVARGLMERNIRNRKQRTSDVDDWAAEMAQGRWRETHQGVAIARDGVILDGQHRLQAIIDSGVTVNLLVVVGLDPEVFTVIDTGRRRTSADALGMVGEANVNQLAAITRACYDYDDAMANGRAVSHRKRLHHDVLLAYRAGKEKQLAEATRVSGGMRGGGLKVNKTAAGAAYFLIKREAGDDEAVDTFFDQIRTGLDLRNTDPVYALRRFISKDAAPKKDRHLAVILKAWSLHAQGRGATTLMWRVDEEMPAVYRGPVSR